MKIALCASMIFSKEMIEVKSELESHWHEVILPHNTEKYAQNVLESETRIESAKNKIEHDLIRKYFDIIKDCDAVLIVNYDKNGITNYIWGNSFLEAAFAYVLRKKVFFLNAIPDMVYTDELKALQPTILDGDVNNIK